jgi:hypothetical protein
MSRWNQLGVLAALLWAGAACGGAPIHIAPEVPEAAATPAAVEVVDARPEWQKKKKILSLWRTSCDFGIVRWGDSDTAPGRAQAVAYWLGKYPLPVTADNKVNLVWFTVHTNRRAPPTGDYDLKEPGLVYGLLHAMECRGGAEMIGGVDKEEMDSPAPLVVDIVVEVGGRSYAGRAVGGVPETQVASAELVGKAVERLVQGVRDGASPASPCARLKGAVAAMPKVAFYAKSYEQYCGGKE